MATNRHIQRVVVFADILHAIAHNSLPQFRIARYHVNQDTKRLTDVVSHHRYARMPEEAAIPVYMEQVWDDLQALTVARALVKRESVSDLQGLRPIFSSLLYVTEQRILDLEYTAASSKADMWQAIGFKAVQAGAFIFILHCLRDIAITAAFFDLLIRRLRDGLCNIPDDNSTDQGAVNLPGGATAAPFLLWLCANGWKACAPPPRQTDRQFFVDRAALICKSANIDSFEKLGACLGRLVFLTEYYLSACGGLWAEIAVSNRFM